MYFLFSNQNPQNNHDDHIDFDLSYYLNINHFHHYTNHLKNHVHLSILYLIIQKDLLKLNLNINCQGSNSQKSHKLFLILTKILGST